MLQISQNDFEISLYGYTKPLLPDAVITPILEETPSEINYDRLIYESRKERDAALLAARQWRDLAEATQREKREVEMEKTVEVVRNFWHNKLVEGGSRAGKILRASLLRK